MVKNNYILINTESSHQQ